MKSMKLNLNIQQLPTITELKTKMTIKTKFVSDNTVYVSIADSSVIKSCTYEKKLKRLHVTFSNNKVYTYSGLSYSRFNRLVNSDSVGTYFAKNIKGKYLSEKRTFVLSNVAVQSFSRMFR